MTFWKHFLKLVWRRPLSAMSALYWHVTRRRVRARNRLREASGDLPFVYAAWIKANEDDANTAATCAHMLQDGGWLPRFQVVLQLSRDLSDAQCRATEASLNDQLYPHWSQAEGLGFPETIDANADFVVPLQVGDRLSSAALFRFAEAARSQPDASILYGDEDVLEAAGRRRPWFKPRWNEELFYALDYLSGSAAIRTPLARKIMRKSPPRDISSFMFRSVEAAMGSITHVPHIVRHANPTKLQEGDRIALVEQQLAARGASSAAGPFGTVKVQWPLPRRLPLVSVIIATRDKVDLLRPCVESVLELTDYPNFEVVIVDNGSVEKPTLTFLAEIDRHPKVRVLPFAQPFNFSAINNFAVQHARGSFLCLLNNDTEVIGRAWLTEMMRYAVRPEIGAVGAKLLYDDGSIQHAGIVIGIGAAAGHAHRFLPAERPGYFRLAHVAHYVSAVTAACLVIDRSKFEAVDGFDEEFAVAFNDVDFCLKVEAAGWRNVYVPHAVLLHHESKSRGKDHAPENVERFRRELAMLKKRWNTEDYNDPVLNPNLSAHSESFVIDI